MRGYEAVMRKMVFFLVFFLGLFQFDFYDDSYLGAARPAIFIFASIALSGILMGEVGTWIFAAAVAFIPGKVLGFHLTSFEFAASVAIVSTLSTMITISLFDTDVPVKSLKHGRLSAWSSSGMVGATVFATMMAYHEISWYSLSFAMCGFLSLTVFHFWSKLHGWGEKIEPVVEVGPISETSVTSSTEASPEPYVEPPPQITVEP